jgi:two-component system, sensor histidine kinase and response regulator
MNPTSQKNSATPTGAAQPAPARILVVDDQPANIQLVGTVLGSLGYEIIPASDGPTALKRLALRTPDLILLDLLMPEMDGCEVCRRVRENPEWVDIPVIFLSAADDKDFIVRALEAGGVDYITKPFNHGELMTRVRTQLALKSARDQLKELAEDKDELLGILTHDLINHLVGMQLSADILCQRMTKRDDPEQAKLCGNIYESTAQLLAFVKEFLANSATEHGFALKLEEINLSEAAAVAVEDYREAASRKRLEITTSVPDEEIIALADRRALRQVLDNLLSNALKFSPAGRRIEVAVRAAGNSVECVIKDQGPGFTPEDQKRMFRRYGRLSARPTANEPSTGLGLSIVKKLVQNLRGELLCASTPGQGTTFIVRLRRPPPGPARQLDKESS